MQFTYGYYGREWLSTCMIKEMFDWIPFTCRISNVFNMFIANYTGPCTDESGIYAVALGTKFEIAWTLSVIIWTQREYARSFDLLSIFFPCALLLLLLSLFCCCCFFTGCKQQASFRIETDVVKLFDCCCSC